MGYERHTVERWEEEAPAAFANPPLIPLLFVVVKCYSSPSTNEENALTRLLDLHPIWAGVYM